MKFIAIIAALIMPAAAYANNCTDFSGKWEDVVVCNTQFELVQTDCNTLKFLFQGTEQVYKIGEATIFKDQKNPDNSYSLTFSWDPQGNKLYSDGQGHTVLKNDGVVYYDHGVNELELKNSDTIVLKTVGHVVEVRNGIRTSNQQNNQCILSKVDSLTPIQPNAQPSPFGLNK